MEGEAVVSDTGASKTVTKKTASIGARAGESVTETPVAVSERAQRAITLAQRWVGESAAAAVDPAAERLAGVLKDANGLPFTVGFVDGVMRPESLPAAASNLQRVAPLVPGFLPWYLRAAVRVGGAVAPGLPYPVVPIARKVLRDMVGHLIVDARPEKLGEAIATLRQSGHRLNLNLLGEAVLGETEALRRLEGIHELIRRPDVDYVSVKVSAVVSHLSMWAYDEVVDSVVDRLTPLYVTAAANGTFINLDMEEYHDLDLTMAVFMRILDDPGLRDMEAGIVLQAYLPDALPALDRLTEWAQKRVDAGGARIKVRLVKGANLAMEKVDAVMHGWRQAPYRDKTDTDANYLRCLDAALRPERSRAVRMGIAGHNLFDIAYAWLLAGDRGVRDDVEFEMLLGMAQGQVEAVSREVGPVLLYVPVVKPAEFDVAISYLVRRLEENASTDNFLSAAFELHEDASLFDRERGRFLASLKRSADPGLQRGAFRTQDRGRAPGGTTAGGAPSSAAASATGADGAADAAQTADASGGADLAATQLVEAEGEELDFGGEQYVETAVFATRESGTQAHGAPGFRNVPDSDPSLPANRVWAREIIARIPASTAGDDTLAAARVTTVKKLNSIIARVKKAATVWGATPAADRAAVLRAAARALHARRAELIEVAASETGKSLPEGDVEVSEAVDFADYYAARARELDRVAGAVFVPSRVTVVTPPWNFPVSIPAGGVLASLAAGSGVVFKPAPQARRCAAVIAEALWEAGVSHDLLALVDIDEGGLGKQLITHRDVDRVILTGSFDTATLFRSWRPDLPLLAETSGKNSMIVMPSADLDLAAADVVRSAFGHAGQKCSAASLVILVGSVGRSERFNRQLIDSVRSLRVGPPTNPMNEVGPVIEVPQGKLKWALSTLDAGEKWLVEPAPLDVGADTAGRYWTPGVRAGVKPGSRFHREEFFGPVLGVMNAANLAEAIELQNAVAYGLTAGLYTQNPDDLATWLDRVQAGNVYVNRGITGAIVQRQPFGGWKRSSVGAGAKAGGPNYLIGLGSWRATDDGARSTTLHLRGLDTRLTDLIEAAQPTLDFPSFGWLRRAALSDAIAWEREFGQVRDVSHLTVERNLFRYRPLPVSVRATADASLQQVLRVALAGLRAGSRFTLSLTAGVPAAVRRVLTAQDVPVFVESDGQWLTRIGAVADGPAARVAEPGSGVSAASASEPAEEERPSSAPRGTGGPGAVRPGAVRPEGVGPEGVGPDDADAADSVRGAGPAASAAVIRPPRVRLVGSADAMAALHARLATALNGDPDVAVYDHEVTTAGRLELLPFLHEQAIAITAHRFGNLDAWSENVI